jgi:hypothetical protein
MSYFSIFSSTRRQPVVIQFNFIFIFIIYCVTILHRRLSKQDSETTEPADWMRLTSPVFGSLVARATNARTEIPSPRSRRHGRSPAKLPLQSPVHKANSNIRQNQCYPPLILGGTLARRGAD